MVHLCDLCKTADAAIYCFGDEAVLCQPCDQSVHGGKVSKKHERVKLQSENETANCDICQDAKAVLFCSEDRALICRRCDTMIHSANDFVAKHHRYLLNGVAVGLKALDNTGNSAVEGSTKRPYSLRNATNTTPGRERDLWSSNSDRDTWRNGPNPNGLAQANTNEGSQPSLIGMSNASGFTRAPSINGASLLSPFGDKVEQGMKDRQQNPQAGPSSSNWGWGNSADLHRPDSTDLTLASELLGIPTATDFTAKDIDAAYIFDDGVDFETGLSSLLEVPNLSFPSFDDPPTVTGNLSLADNSGQFGFPNSPKGLGQSPTDGLVPSLQSNKRQKL